MSWAGSGVGKGQNLTKVPPSLRKKKIYRCPYEGCGKESPRKYNINVHMRIHTGEAPYVCRYTGCGQTFKWKSSLGNHEKGHLERENTPTESGERVDRVEPALSHNITRTSHSTGHAVRRCPDERVSSATAKGSSNRLMNNTPLDTPILTVSELDNMLGESVEESSYHSLLSFDLSHEDLSAVSGMNRRFSHLDPPETEEVSSQALDRMVLGEHQWR